MPRVHTQVARKDIYRQGKRIDDPSTKRGYRMDRSQPADENDSVLIPAGSTYYKWTFRYGGTHRSLTRPKPSQLTQSAFLSTVYGIQEELEGMYGMDNWEEIASQVEEIHSQLEDLQSETEDSLSNMPDSLQYSPTGEMLQERIDALDEMMSALDEFMDAGSLEDQFEDDYETGLEEICCISYEGP